MCTMDRMQTNKDKYVKERVKYANVTNKYWNMLDGGGRGQHESRNIIKYGKYDEL